MAKSLRVFELAKELGVKSKAVVEKCEAEDVPDITNHMSTVKLGLAETIRQWFGDQVSEATTEGGTAVETAEKVDLKTVRKARPRKKAATKKKASAKKTEAPPEASPEVSPEVSPAADAAVAVAVAPEVTEEPVPEVLPDEVAPPAEAASTATPTPKPAKAVKPTGPIGKPNVPVRPRIVKPVGAQLEKPKQARLKGPNVIRIEKPDPIRAPRPRRNGPGGPGGPGNGPQTLAPGEVPGITRARGPARGRGAGGGGGGEDTSRPNKRRSLSSRRGRSADALPTGPTKFSQADMEELDARLRGSTGFIKQRRHSMTKREGAGPAQSALVTGGKVEIQEPITIKSLSAATGLKTADIVKYLFQKGVMATINSAIDTETAMEVALEYDIELEVKEQKSALEILEEQIKVREEIDMRPRPPIVTVLGHVDHGKTSLLDRIRQADVAAHESGGITQHVGAYRVTVDTGDAGRKTVVFLDTPGHEAFTSMRSRGAKMTDLVVLVCAADDGVMPQTIESINHAKAAGARIIVALNKIDTPQATEENIQRIYGQLAEHGLNPTEWGGETEIVKTSAITGEGVEDLIETLDYQAELLELKADYGGAARGTVIESEMQTGRGSVARLMVEDGQLCVGDFVVVGRAFGRVRDMTDDRGRPFKEAGPATPLELSGIDTIPDAGDKFYVTDTLQKAEQIAKQYRDLERNQQLASKTKVTLDNFSDAVAAGQTRELRVVLKADVQGSIDVLRKSLEGIGNKEVAVRVLHAAVGGVTESDVLLADASDAIIIGFHVIATPAVREIADERKVDIRLYRVIYETLDEIKQALEGMLEPDRKEEQLGIADVREPFKVSKVGTVAGCLVSDGSIRKNAKVRVVRDGIVIIDDRDIESLKRVKDDAREVRAGTECGIKVAGFDDVKSGDQIIAYNIIEVKRTLD